nr:isoprenylcysteine carboxylmethyltransferase family protein [Melghirimyces algeriensis]
MNDWFVVVMIGVILQRGMELSIAKKHTEWIRSRGGYEEGRGHYPLLVIIHLFLFIGLFVEVTIFRVTPPFWWPVPFLVFLIAQGFRIWCIRSLGPYWNTRIMVIPGHQPVVRGPYRFLRHPNYWVVITEILTLPVMFGAYVTATITSLFNLWVLFKVRIPTEEKALATAMLYGKETGSLEGDET